MRWRRLRWATATVLCAWLLLANVYGQFTPVRRKIVRSPQPAQHAIALAVDGAAVPTDPQWVLVCVVRNDSSTALELRLSVAGEECRTARVAPHASSRVDVAFPRPRETRDRYEVQLVGSGGDWALTYLEVANLHGFTRGAVDLLVLPAAQPFGRVPSWWLAALLACALLVFDHRALRVPAWARVPWLVIAGVIAVVFTAIAVSPLVSPFRVVLSPGTFAAGALVLAAPRLAALGRRLWVPALAGARLKAVPWPAVLAVAALVAYASYLAAHVGAYAAGADSSGYLNSARLLAQRRVSAPMRIVAGVAPTDLPSYAYVPLGFRPRGTDQLVPIYPTGLPLATIATAQVTGWRLAPAVTIVCHGLLGVVLMFVLGRWVGLSSGWAAMGALILATSPQYLLSSAWFMSDTPALAWTTAAVLLAWRSRRDARWAGLAGAAVAFSVLVRPTNVLVMAPVAVCLGVSLRRWVWLGIGGAPGTVFLLLHNHAAYGSALSTGYGDTGALFDRANVWPALQNYAAWFPVLLTPLIVLVLGLPLVWRRAPRRVAVLLAWIAPFVVVYAFYYHTHEAWWYLRFLQPVFPPLVAGALLVGCAIVERLPLPATRGARTRLAWLAGLALATAILAHNARWSEKLDVPDTGRRERFYVDVTDWARTHLPSNSVVAAMQVTGAFFYYTDFPLLRWDSFLPESFSRVAEALASRRQPLYAVLFPFERDERRVLSERLPGKWTLVGTVHDATVWRFDGPDR